MPLFIYISTYLLYKLRDSIAPDMTTNYTKKNFIPSTSDTPKRLLLHACCGPCSIEPLRVLKERGIEPAIHFSNSNIAPFSEYEHRLSTIKNFAKAENIEIVEDTYDNSAWKETAGKIGVAEEGSEKRRARCRACYRLRLEKSAQYAISNGYDALGTTLSVSPYQYGDIIAEELDRACRKYDIDAFYEDYSPLYSNATKRSKEAGMYRQNYCGCLLSQDEAEQSRQQRRAIRQQEKAARAKLREAEEAKIALKREERKAYDAKQAHKKAILKALREKRQRNSEDDATSDIITDADHIQ